MKYTQGTLGKSLEEGKKIIKKGDALYIAIEEIIWEATQISTYLSEAVVLCSLICNSFALKILLRGKKLLQIVVA